MRRLIRWALLAAFVMASWNVSAMGGPLTMPKNTLAGKAAPDFVLPTLAGAKISFTEYRNGQKAIIFFWATWCPHCREALAEINQDLENFKRQDIKLVIVDVGEIEKEVRAYTVRYKIGMDVFIDADSEVSERYGIIGVPTFFFVNSSGKVVDVRHNLPEHYEEIFSASPYGPL